MTSDYKKNYISEICIKKTILDSLESNLERNPNNVINKKINNNFVFPNTPAQLMLDDTCLLL